MAVSELKTTRKQSKDIVIEVLEDSIIKAKEEGTTSVVVIFDDGSSVSWLRGGLYSLASLIGNLEVCKAQFFDRDKDW